MITNYTDEVLTTVIGIYMEDYDLPLPTHEEVLICSPTTKTEEVLLLRLSYVMKRILY